MAKTVLKTEQDVRDFVRGCTFMGTGGGGLEENGVESLLSELRQGKEISWIDVDDVPDDAVTACPFLMGTIAPHTPELIQEMEGLGKLETNRREAAGKKGTAKQAVVKQPKKGTYVAKIRRARRNDSLR